MGNQTARRDLVLKEDAIKNPNPKGGHRRYTSGGLAVNEVDVVTYGPIGGPSLGDVVEK